MISEKKRLPKVATKDTIKAKKTKVKPLWFDFKDKPKDKIMLPHQLLNLIQHE